MNLLASVSFVCLSILVYNALLIGYRNPQPPRWVGGFVITSLYAIAVLILPVLGLGSLLSFFTAMGHSALSVAEVLASLAVIVASASITRRIRGKVKRYLSAVPEPAETKPRVSVTPVHST